MLVPAGDYELLKHMRQVMSERGSFLLRSIEQSVSPEHVGKAYYNNAKFLFEYYGLSHHEVIEETGIYLEGVEDGEDQCDQDQVL